MKKFSIFILWCAVTALIAAEIIFIVLRWGQSGLGLFFQQWPLTNLPLTLASVLIVWLLAGAFIHLLENHKINSENIFTIAGFFIVALVYVNVLRERFRYGDYQYYQAAANAMLNHRQLPDSYFYPPLWAVLIQFLGPLSDELFLLVLWTINIISLFAFYWILHRVLERYGFSSRFAALITTFFMLINVPLLRTLGYVQVNIHVLNLVFLSVLFHPKKPFLSALMLALAVHLKTSPVVLALAFLLEKDWRWMFWFALNLILIAAVTIVTNGISPYYDFLRNTSVLSQLPDTIFHDSSFESFIRFVDQFLRIPLPTTRVIVYVAKAIFALITLFVMFRSIRDQRFSAKDEPAPNLLDALPSLFILMTLASPLVWEHHGIFVALPFLLMLKRVETCGEWTWFGSAYFLQFMVPTFDFFPWSYGRLFAPMIILWLIWRTGKSASFSYLNDWVADLKLSLKRQENGQI